MRILGIDPGLQTTGFGLIDVDGHRLSYVASGTIRTTALALGDLPGRLKVLFDGISEVAARYQPDVATVEIVFVNVNPQSTLLLGQARGAAITALVASNLPVAEYTALQMKKAVVGHGRAAKNQVQEMVRRCCSCRACPAPTPPMRWAWPSRTRTRARPWPGSAKRPRCSGASTRCTRAGAATEQAPAAARGFVPLRNAGHRHSPRHSVKAQPCQTLPASRRTAGADPALPEPSVARCNTDAAVEGAMAPDDKAYCPIPRLSSLSSNSTWLEAWRQRPLSS